MTKTEREILKTVKKYIDAKISLEIENHYNISHDVESTISYIEFDRANKAFLDLLK